MHQNTCQAGHTPAVSCPIEQQHAPTMAPVLEPELSESEVVLAVVPSVVAAVLLLHSGWDCVAA